MTSLTTHTNLLRNAYDAATGAAQPVVCLPPHFPPPPKGKLICLCTGKAAAAMAETAARHYQTLLPDDRFIGMATVRTGYGKQVDRFEFMEASHPVPDGNSERAAARALQLAAMAGEDDLLLVLMSGGASALWSAPVAGLQLAEKQDLTRTLLKVGATITEINCVRKHLSRIKGGRLAAAAYPARILTLAISDVPGDAPDAIGSGPTVADPTTLPDARDILNKYDIRITSAISSTLTNDSNETLKPGAPSLANAEYILAATPGAALKAAAQIVERAGYEPVLLGDSLEGEARNVAKDHARLALKLRDEGKRAAILSGGELTVTIRGDGRGGPNQEYALALAIALNGTPGIHALAADTDGSDGGTGKVDDPAGAFVSPDTISRALEFGQNAGDFLAKNDSTGFFEMLKDLLVTGPTFTNVNDLRVILVEPGER
ncbi:MAG: glycerate kinase [Hyphomicrobiales bacterium]|nr:glycerate kinase [Hyphomicrobiales bacterium]